MVPTDKSNSVPKVPKLRGGGGGGGHFVPKSSKVDVKDFQKQLYESVASIIKSKSTKNPWSRSQMELRY